MTTLQELLDRKAKIDEQIESLRRTERAAAIERVRALMNEYGLAAADLSVRGAARASRSSKPAGAARAGVKIAAKYHDAATGESWSGRGLQPRWLKKALAAGKKIDDFAVQA